MRMTVEGMNNAYQVGNFYFGGQLNDAAMAHFKSLGVTKVYNLRNEEEGDFSWEEDFCEKEGMQYKQIPFLVDGAVNDDCVKELSSLNESDKALIHCASGNRIGAWYVIYCVKNKGLSFDEASKLAFEVGLTNPGLLGPVQEYLS
ncbi:MAG: hypothetical protein ACPGJV_13095 [Bacteriovoracaceae bacterium]